jgi:hypothetical protein
VGLSLCQLHAGGAAYLVVMSRSLAGTCAAVTSLLWLVALRYGAFQRRSQRLFQDALADTGQVAEEVGLVITCRVR